MLAIRYERIPLQEKHELVGYVVIPRTNSPIGDRTKVISDLQMYQAKLNELKPLAPSESAQQKYTNTEEFMYPVVSFCSGISNNSSMWQIFTQDL